MVQKAFAMLDKSGTG
jgi:Ca2+-binding EF-hand superfamily protein